VKKYLIAVAIVVVLAVAGVIGYERFGGNAGPIPTGDTATAATQADQPPFYDDDKVMGDPQAPVAMIEYASLTCPHCAHFHNDVLPEIEKTYIDTGKVKLIYRDFPLNEAALRGAQLAHCVPAQNYFGMVALLFRNQDSWAFGADPVAELKKIAATAGIDETKFEACLKDQTTVDAIVARAKEAQDKYGVASTPAFFINGRKISGAQPFEDFDKVIKEALP
jgi:protein-disulfide isomerase